MNFLSYLISGISLGSVYALIALGYTMVYGIAKMLNFAHGDVIMIGGFVIFTAVSSMHTSAGVAIVCAIIVCTVLGVSIEKIAYKPLRNAPPLAVLITAIGVSYFLQNVALLIFGSASRNFPDILHLPTVQPVLRQSIAGRYNPVCFLDLKPPEFHRLLFPSYPCQ